MPMRVRNQIPSIERTCLWDGTDRLWTVPACASVESLILSENTKNVTKNLPAHFTGIC